ncbi:MAG: hypothetical protein FRX49_11285 [Trebouxia sp. A1-2]|nr:MAG: hypothetical protein FRX49_11285 [Trebouxia sp. A1-2]
MEELLSAQDGGHLRLEAALAAGNAQQGSGGHLLQRQHSHTHKRPQHTSYLHDMTAICSKIIGQHNHIKKRLSLTVSPTSVLSRAEKYSSRHPRSLLSSSSLDSFWGAAGGAWLGAAAASTAGKQEKESQRGRWGCQQAAQIDEGAKDKQKLT